MSREAGVWPTGTTRVAAVIGDPVRHSLSPALHNAAFQALNLDWAFLAFEVAEADLAAAVAGVRALGIEGLSVTMPHKTAVAAVVDKLTPVAEALGAVNTVARRGSVLIGDSTDGAGFLDALRDDEAFDPAGRRCVVAGAGGAARAIVHALGDAGAADIAILNRTPARAELATALAPFARVGSARDVGDADLVVNATPLGMEGQEDGMLFPADLLGAGQLVVDTVYHPAVTPLMAEARRRGAVAVNGVGMLIHQAAHAFRLWTGEDPPLGVMSAAVARHLAHSRGRD